MGEALSVALKILGVVIALAGMVVVYAAPKIVSKYKLDEKKVIDPERVQNLNEEGVQKFKKDAAIVDVKIKGVLLALPGLIIILIMFKL